MAYITQSDLVPLRITQAELVQLTDDTNSDQVNAVVVNGALEEASGRIDSYCRERYQTPLQVTDVVRGLALDICVYLLFSRRRSIRMAETVRQRNEDAIALLKDISTGKATLDQPVGNTAQASSGGPEISSKRERFSEREIGGFV